MTYRKCVKFVRRNNQLVIIQIQMSYIPQILYAVWQSHQSSVAQVQHLSQRKKNHHMNIYAQLCIKRYCEDLARFRCGYLRGQLTVEFSPHIIKQ